MFLEKRIHITTPLPAEHGYVLLNIEFVKTISSSIYNCI